MEEVSNEQILIALSDPSFIDDTNVLLSTLAERVGNDFDSIDEQFARDIFFVTMKKLLDPLISEDLVQVQILISILSNLTISDSNCQIFIELFCDNESSSLLLLLSKFFDFNQDQNSSNSSDNENSDYWEHISSLLCNISRFENGRNLILNKSNQITEKLLHQIHCSNPVRRKGAIGSIRSCLFDEGVHWWMVDEINILFYLLLPLITPTPFSEREKKGMDERLVQEAENPLKVVEKDLEVMKLLLECVLLLCQKRVMREAMRRKKVYAIVKNLDLVVEDEDVSSVIFEIVNFLERDESFDDERDDASKEKV